MPAGYLVWAALTGSLSANPLGDITNGTGDWTLRFLCIMLAVTPLRRLSGWNGAVKFRRMLGLFAFFYGALHFMTYVILDRLAGFDFSEPILSWTTARGLATSVGEDLITRPFITVGFTAFALMIPLAATSSGGMIRRLGGRRWRALHRLVYVSCIAATVHYWWLVKADISRPMAYGGFVAVLLAFRLYGSRPRPKAALRGTRTALRIDNVVR
jgi:sulfoxide reductase heme-binding subunit YedZ